MQGTNRIIYEYVDNKDTINLYRAVVYVMTRLLIIYTAITEFSPSDDQPVWIDNFLTANGYLHTMGNPLVLLIIYDPVRRAVSTRLNGLREINRFVVTSQLLTATVPSTSASVK